MSILTVIQCPPFTLQHEGAVVKDDGKSMVTDAPLL